LLWVISNNAIDRPHLTAYECFTVTGSIWCSMSKILLA